MNLTWRSRFILLAGPPVLAAGILLGQCAWGSLSVSQAPKYTDVDLQALGSFVFNQTSGQTSDIPNRWRDLDGRRVSLNGFMSNPMTAGPGADSYQLVCDSHPSHFKPPLIQERVFATAPATMYVYSSEDPLRLDGVLHVGVQRDASGTMLSLFRMDVETVTPLNRIPPRLAPAAHFTIWDSLLLWHLLVGAFLVVTRLLHFRVGPRGAIGLCPACGYDLRATPTRCPECGAVQAAKGAR